MGNYARLRLGVQCRSDTFCPACRVRISIGEPIYTCLTISGDDRSTFLQGQLTQDVSSISVGSSAAAAWCSPKGRVIVTLRVLNLGDAFGLVMPVDSLDPVQRRLAMYRLRANVEMNPDDRVISRAVPLALLPEDPERRPIYVKLNQDTVEVHDLQDRWTASGLDPDAGLDDAAWRAERIRSGLVDIGTDNTERYTPHMINLDRTGYISFQKGCYTGQEVVARTEHLGRVKRRIQRFTCDAEGITPGDRLMAGEQEAGTVVNAAGGELLALASTSDLADDLTVNGVSAVRQPLPYSLD